jgi:hypothetical protein
MSKVKKKVKITEEQGLKQSWLNFIDEYLVCGNATEAYLKAYDPKGEGKMNRHTAQVGGSELLSKPVIIQELKYRYSAQKITKSGILSELWDIAQNYRGSKTINASVSALRILSQAKGMLEQAAGERWNGDIIIRAVVDQKNKEKWDKETDRISE